MGDGVGLVADKVVEAVGAVGVNKAVADPLAGANGLVDVSNNLEGGFDAVIFDFTGVESGNVIFTGETEDVESFFAGKGD